MSTIYARAQQVILWLGQDSSTNDADKTLSLVEEIYQAATSSSTFSTPYDLDENTTIRVALAFDKYIVRLAESVATSSSEAEYAVSSSKGSTDILACDHLGQRIREFVARRYFERRWVSFPFSPVIDLPSHVYE